MFFLPIWFSALLLTLIMQNEQGPRFNLGTSVFRGGEELTYHSRYEWNPTTAMITQNRPDTNLKLWVGSRRIASAAVVDLSSS